MRKLAFILYILLYLSYYKAHYFRIFQSYTRIIMKMHTFAFSFEKFTLIFRKRKL